MNEQRELVGRREGRRPQESRRQGYLRVGRGHLWSRKDTWQLINFESVCGFSMNFQV